MSHVAGIRHLFRFGWRASVAALTLSALLAACGGGSNDDSTDSPQAQGLVPKKITFMAGFKPQANLPFAGVYVAQEKGFFKELNLDVDIRHAQSGEHLQLLLAGEVQVATANAAQVLQRHAEGLALGLHDAQVRFGEVVGVDVEGRHALRSAARLLAARAAHERSWLHRSSAVRA